MNTFQLIVPTKYFRDYQVEDRFFFHSMSNQHWKTGVLHLLLLLGLIRLIEQLLKEVETALDAFSKMLKILLPAYYDQIHIKDNDQVHHFFLYCSHILYAHCHLYHYHPFLCSNIQIQILKKMFSQLTFFIGRSIGLLLHDEYPKSPLHSTTKVIFHETI